MKGPMSDGSELFDAATKMFREGFEGGSGEQKRTELRLLFADLAHGVKGSELEYPLDHAAGVLNKRPDSEPLPLEAALKAVAG